MDYMQGNINFLTDGDEEAWTNWIASEPLLDQVDILNDLTALLTEVNEDEAIPGMAEAIARLEQVTNDYQERILDEQLALLKLEMVEEEIQKEVMEIDEMTKRIRAYVIDCILTAASNAKEMRKLAKDMVALEKQWGTYDPHNWILYNPDNDHRL